MKNALAGLKNMNYKQFAVNHGEKLGLGLIGLLAVFVLFSSHWSTTIEITPVDIQDQVRASTNKVVNNNDWPDEEKTQFVSMRDMETTAKNLFHPLDIAPYRYSTEMSFPLYRPIEKSREPTFYPVEDLLADSGKLLLSLRNGGAADDELNSDDPNSEDGKTPDADVDDDDDFQRRTAPAAGAGNSASAGLAAAGAAGLDGDGALGGNFGASVDATEDGIAGAGAGDDPSDMASLGAGGEGGLMVQNGRGERYVSVRGVFPIKKQANENRSALALPNTIPASRLVDLMDFELQRKTAVGGPNPWSGEWQSVDLETAEDILQQTSSFETDVVPNGITDPTVVMPLPARLTGIWKKKVSHPRVENFELSEEERELERKRNEAILKRHQEQAEKKADLPVKGGFSGMMVDIKTAQSDVMSGAGGMDFMRDMQNQLYKGSSSQTRTNSQDKQRRSAAGHLLLFRFIDFAVEPGNAYIYRVRLVMRNPNFNRPLDELEDAESAKGPLRQTPWSNLSTPVVVRKDVEYYLTKVNPRSLNASLNIFQWSLDSGTTINSVLNVQLGQFVGGKEKTDVVRPAASTFMNEEVEFSTKDMLVDTIAARPLDSELHPELRLTRQQRGRIGLPDEALIIDHTGKLVTLDSLSGRDAEQAAKARLKRLFDYYEDLKEEESDDSDLGELEGLGLDDMGMGGDEEGGRRSGRRSGSPLRRRDGKRNSMSDMMRSYGKTQDSGNSGGAPQGFPSSGRKSGGGAGGYPGSSRPK